MFVIRDGGEDDNSRFIPIAAQNEGDWQALHEQAVGDIVVAHSWFRTLSGLDYARDSAPSASSTNTKRL